MDRAETKQRLIELRQLAKLADQNIYRRVSLAAEVLQDIGWIADEFEGDEWLARDYLSRHFFASLAGYVQLDTLLAIRSMFPRETEWSEHNYDLRAMELLWEEQRQVEARQSQAVARPRATHADLEAAQTEASTQRVAATKATQEKAAALREVERLRRRVAELEAANAALQAENDRLTAQVAALSASVVGVA